MSKGIIILIVIVLLSGTFAFTAYASYSGYGLVASGTTSSRVGSITGPRIFSGGFGGGFGGGGK